MKNTLLKIFTVAAYLIGAGVAFLALASIYFTILEILKNI